MSGKLEVITGSMFSGKSEELIRRVKRAKLAKRKVVVFKHSIDKRYKNDEVVSHNQNSLKAYPVSTVSEMNDIILNKICVEIVAIDEAQFFGDEIIEFIDKLVNKNIRVIVAGLDLDFKGEPFYPMPVLMAKADSVSKLKAICTISGEDAWCSQRLINGEPAYYDDPLVVIGAKESYEARSRRYHVVRYRDKEIKEIKIILNNSDLDYSIIKEKINDEIYQVKIENAIELVKYLENRLFEQKYDDVIKTGYIYIDSSILKDSKNNKTMFKLLSQYSKYLHIYLISGNNEYNDNLIIQILNMYKIENISNMEI